MTEDGKKVRRKWTMLVLQTAPHQEQRNISPTAGRAISTIATLALTLEVLLLLTATLYQRGYPRCPKLAVCTDPTAVRTIVSDSAKSF